MRPSFPVFVQNLDVRTPVIADGKAPLNLGAFVTPEDGSRFTVSCADAKVIQIPLQEIRNDLYMANFGTANRIQTHSFSQNNTPFRRLRQQMRLFFVVLKA
jgi:hypothetical protein